MDCIVGAQEPSSAADGCRMREGTRDTGIIDGMSTLRPVVASPRTARGVDAPVPLSRAERIVLMVAIAGAFLTTVLGAAFGDEPFSFLILLDLAVTATFALFLISPPSAVATLAAIMVPALLLDWSGPGFAALAVATGLVTRTGSTRLMVAFTGLLLLTAAAIVLRQPEEPVYVGIGLLIAAIAGAAGILLRSARGREQRLDAALREQASVMAQLRRDERLLIADELHDVIAHDLTAIAMQARLMEREDDPAQRAQTQREIGDAARRALGDIRRLITPVPGEAPTERIDDFDTTLAEMAATLRTAGYTPEVTTDLAQPIPRLVDGTLARVLRESTTNIMKHGRPGPVRIRVGVDAEEARVQVSNARPAHRSRERLPSGGFGSVRLAERVGLLGGEFTQGIEGDEWVVRAALPLT